MVCGEGGRRLAYGIALAVPLPRAKRRGLEEWAAAAAAAAESVADAVPTTNGRVEVRLSGSVLAVRGARLPCDRWLPYGSFKPLITVPQLAGHPGIFVDAQARSGGDFTESRKVCDMITGLPISAIRAVHVPTLKWFRERHFCLLPELLLRDHQRAPAAGYDPCQISPISSRGLGGNVGGGVCR